MWPRSGREPAGSLTLWRAMQAPARPALAGPRYGALDGLRGVAAIAVALGHYDNAIVPAGYLAVDLFFLLSGFILTRTYAPQLAAGLGAGRLILKRMIRLYPLHVTGILIATLSVVQGLLRARPGRMPLADLVHSFPFNVLLLPSPYSFVLFPLNGRGVAVRLGLPEVALAPVYLAVALGLAALCTCWIDGPVRRALTRRFLASQRPV